MSKQNSKEESAELSRLCKPRLHRENREQNQINTERSIFLIHYILEIIYLITFHVNKISRLIFIFFLYCFFDLYNVLANKNQFNTTYTTNVKFKDIFFGCKSFQMINFRHLIVASVAYVKDCVNGNVQKVEKSNLKQLYNLKKKNSEILTSISKMVTIPFCKTSACPPACGLPPGLYGAVPVKLLATVSPSSRNPRPNDLAA